MKKRKTHRMDIQVAIMTSCIVTISSILMAVVSYAISYNDMILSLQDRVSAIYYGLQEELDEHNFTNIHTKEDMNSAAYKEIQHLLREIKETSGVRYLYTAKELEDGSFIYLVDGLSPDSHDFRYPGDLIEHEIQSEMKKALTAKIVMPKDIQSTSWGPIFISYLPIMLDGDVMGVLGIEFDATHQYNTYNFLMVSMIVMIICFCIITWWVAFKMFGRISNPTYQDLSNTDMLTGLKNRNSFETDVHNLNHRNKIKIGFLSIDLDCLKVVNDTDGHAAGDDYIISCVNVVRDSLTGDAIMYRTGGDEFIIIVHDASLGVMEEMLSRIESSVLKANSIRTKPLSLSVGYALFDIGNDENLLKTLERADINMYRAKKIKKEKLNSDATFQKA